MPAPPSPLVLDWRSGQFSDWICTLGDIEYRLHRVVLASKTRGCEFFQGAFNGGFEASTTDLAAVLPAECHSHIETALDFVYGNDIAFTLDGALKLCKIADVLSSDALFEASFAAVERLFTVTSESVRKVFELDLPPKVLEFVCGEVPLKYILEGLALNPATPHIGMILQISSKMAARPRLVDLPYVQPSLIPAGVDYTMSVTVDFKGRATQHLHDEPIQNKEASCRLKLTRLYCSGPTIGLARLGVDASCRSCADGGFARNSQCWGLCLESGNLWAEGAKVRDTGFREFHLGQIIIRIEFDSVQNSLRFVKEADNGEDQEVGQISASFDQYDDLVFTACACCRQTRYDILSLRV